MNAMAQIPGLLAVMVAISGAAAQTVDAESQADGLIEFAVERKGNRIGTHQIAFFERDNGFDVHVAIDLKVKFAFITLYSYTHRNRETWRDGELVAIETWTETKGERMEVSGRQTAAGFEVSPDEGEPYVIDRPFLPSSYWHPGTASQNLLLNTQSGDLAEISVEPADIRLADADEDAPIDTTVYQMTGDIRLSLAYARGGCFSDLAFTAPSDGSRITYQRIRHLWDDKRSGLSGQPLLRPCIEGEQRTALDGAGPAGYSASP